MGTALLMSICNIHICFYGEIRKIKSTLLCLKMLVEWDICIDPDPNDSIQFGFNESKGLTWLKFMCHDVIMISQHILKQFSSVVCKSKDLYMYKNCESHISKII